MRTLYQLIGDGIEELWYFPNELSSTDIIKYYEEWEQQELTDSFEEFMVRAYPEIDCERVFVEEVYV